MGCGASSKAKSADESVVNTTPAKKEESNTVPAADSIPLPLSLSTEIPTASPKAVFPQESVSPTYPPSLATPEDSASSSQFRKSFQSTLLRLLERNVDMVFLRSLVNASMDEQRVLLKEKLGPCVVRELAILHQTASIELQTNVTEYILDNYMTDELLVVLQDESALKEKTEIAVKALEENKKEQLHDKWGLHSELKEKKDELTEFLATLKRHHNGT